MESCNIQHIHIIYDDTFIEKNSWCILHSFVSSTLPYFFLGIKKEKSFASNDSSEIMTPYFEENKYQPFSRVSVAALADLGYEVDMSAADPLKIHDSESDNDIEMGKFTKLDDELLVLDGQRPSKTFVLDSSNMIEPEIKIIDL